MLGGGPLFPGTEPSLPLRTVALVAPPTRPLIMLCLATVSSRARIHCSLSSESLAWKWKVLPSTVTVNVASSYSEKPNGVWVKKMYTTCKNITILLHWVRKTSKNNYMMFYTLVKDPFWKYIVMGQPEGTNIHFCLQMCVFIHLLSWNIKQHAQERKPLSLLRNFTLTLQYAE